MASVLRLTRPWRRSVTCISAMFPMSPARLLRRARTLTWGSEAGTVATTPTTVSVLPGTKYIYLNIATVTVNTTNVGSEIETPLPVLDGTAITTGSRLDLLAAYIYADGGFYFELIL